MCYHILPAFSFDAGLQWDSMASTAYNGYKSIGDKIGYKMAIKLLWLALPIICNHYIA